MIHRYAFSNFQSFAQRTEVSFLIGRGAQSRWTRETTTGKRLSTAVAVFGANAAGKTALIKPIAFADWFIGQSFSASSKEPVPFEPHFSDINEPSLLEVEIEDDGGVMWRYELELRSKLVHREALYRKQDSRYNYAFIREADGRGGYNFKLRGLQISKKEADRVRPNASLISTAAQYGDENAESYKQMLTVATNVSHMGKRVFDDSIIEDACYMYSKIPKLQERMVDLLKRWDLGLDGVELDQHKVDDQESWVPFGIHLNRAGEKVRIRLEQESSGTRAAFATLARVLFCLEAGGLAVMDELESDLHPHLVEAIVELFDDESTNPNGAQLLFSCHTTSILTVFSKAQVYFVEKRRCESEAYRADKIEGLRSDDNLRAKYESGSLGGIPRI